MESMRAGVYMQTLFRDRVEGAMHSFIYFSFLILLAVTTILEINHQLPVDLKFLHGGVYQGYSFIADLAGLTFLIGVGWAILRRYVARPYRLRLKTRPEHALILGTFLVLGVTGFVIEAFRIAMLRPQDGSGIGCRLREVVVHRVSVVQPRQRYGPCAERMRPASQRGDLSWENHPVSRQPGNGGESRGKSRSRRRRR